MDIGIYLVPSAEIQLGVGTIYLYRLRSPDLSRFEKLPAGDPLSRLREFLPCVASQTNITAFNEEREPLSAELVAQITDDELELLADVYASSSALQRHRTASENEAHMPRQNTESAATYLDRLLSHEVEDHRKDLQQMREHMLGPADRIFDQVRKSSFHLGQSISAFESLKAAEATPVLDSRLSGTMQLINEQHARAAEERAEELKMARLTGEMAVQSAKMLQELAAAADTFLKRFDARSQESDRVTRIQLWIAVGSVALSAILAAVALYYAAATYQQDKENNAANDKWQANVLTSVKEGTSADKALESEVKVLRARIDAATSNASQPRNKPR